MFYVTHDGVTVQFNSKCGLRSRNINTIMFCYIIISVGLVCIIDAAQVSYINSLPNGITIHNVVASWSDAQRRCAGKGAIIASPINESVYNAMKSLIDVRNTTFYIGARATDLSGRFVSLEGVSLEDMTVAMINMSPHLEPRDGDCVAMNSDTMRVVPCSTRLPYMCLKQSQNDTAPNVEQSSVTVETGSTQAPESQPVYEYEDEQGYKYGITTFKYYKMHTEHVQWADARNSCLAEGGDLAVIAHSGEMLVIRDLYNFIDDDWIFVGLRLNAETNDWRSIHGQPVTELYNDWRKGRPEKFESFGCGALHKFGELADIYCTSSRPFVCEKQFSEVHTCGH